MQIFAIKNNEREEWHEDELKGKSLCLMRWYLILCIFKSVFYPLIPAHNIFSNNQCLKSFSPALYFFTLIV